MIHYENASLKVAKREPETYEFNGNIDHFFLAQDLPVSTEQLITLDLAKLKLINSCGVRELIRWLNSNPAYSEMKFINCPIFFVQQASMVKGIVNQKRKIFSFYAPYFDSVANEEIPILLNYADIINYKAPSQMMPNRDLSFDSIEEKYFNFIRLQNAG
jgi:hypothetical protein